ncbi:MAG: hypothetical protein U9Q06_00245 [Nanoarchaeota archaeon]|nr:hypothetical protein [Nanoarchaeota archaeon]
MSKEIDEILKKYESKISSQINPDVDVGDVSKDYAQFKRDMLPNLGKFESLAHSFGSFLKLKLSEKDKKKMQKNLTSAHLDVSPGEVVSFAFSASFILFLVVAIFVFGAYFIKPAGVSGTIFDYIIGSGGLFLLLTFFAAIFVFYYIYSSPERMAKLWKLRAGAQMVPCILYVVVYMKHTSNLERAISFASQHLNPPLAFDLKKIFWDVETGRFSSIKESLDFYLETWKEDAVEFVEAFHLIESSLYEPSNVRRVQILEKSLQVILDGVYENMMVFSRKVRAPLTNVYMLGIVLPTLGLALLPLASTLLGGLITWYHVFILFNLIVPFFVFYLTNQVMLERPGGYGESEILELSPKYGQYKSKRPYVIAALICLPFFIIGVLPFLFQSVFLVDVLNLQPDYSLASFGLPMGDDIWLFDFKSVENGNTIKTLEELKIAKDGKIVGPFGIGALLMSLFLPLSIALFFSFAYKMRTKELINSRGDTRQLEAEFTNSLFQLGNRLGDGVPAEIAFAKVAQSTSGLKTANFFKIVNLNLHHGGMSLENAIFNPQRGALIYFPSQLISTSMRILLESVKKGLNIAAQSLMSISEYLKNIQKVTNRLKDLLAEVVSDMKSNMVFLAPLLSGIVVGLAAMITFILNKLGGLMEGEMGGDAGGFMSLGGFDSLFNVVDMIPPYFLQIAVGIYIIQIIFILTNVLVTVDSGDDKLKKTYDIGRNLIKGATMYFVVALISILTLSVLATVALSSGF